MYRIFEAQPIAGSEGHISGTCYEIPPIPDLHILPQQIY